ncbi:MAG: COR domain-containing protein [Cyanobacteria bacterium P01_F01_bin.143]
MSKKNTKIKQTIAKAKKENSSILNLSRHELTEIPSKIFRMTYLKELILSSNQLTSIPESITNLSNLTKLNLSSNQLTSIPESITKLSNLKELNLSSNQLTDIPEFINNLSDLTHLYLSNNQLKNVPDSITKIPSLIKLNLTSNQIVNVSKSIDELSNLTWLNLNSNQLKSIPKSIENLFNLTELYLKNNPMEVPPIEIVNKGVEEIRGYFRQLEEGEEDYLYEAKLLIIGQGGAGKTTLAKKIQNPDYQLQSDEESTKGIDVIKWNFKLDQKQDFNVNIWDFAGQTIYQTTHEFFLTKRSLYLLVADTRKEDTDFYYWLNIVEMLSDNSPLLIIQNERQDRKTEINKRELRGEFTNLKEIIPTNLATNRGLDSVVNDIKHYIKNLDHIGAALPKTWKRVRQALEKDTRNYIKLDEYLKICEQNGFTKLKDKLQLSGYLHDLGVCLHFQDEEDSLLYRTVILKPEWGTDAVYKVLDNSQVIAQKGSFNRGDLNNIWQAEKYAAMRGELLELMKKFQLCYEIPESKNNFIAPQLLPGNQPEYSWDKSNNLILRYNYYTFMPKGIITRFIVVMHEYIDQQYVWKNGVILEKNNTKAEIIENSSKTEIKIRVVGSNKRDLMTIITHEIDKINKSYKRLEYQQLIPCNCEICINSQQPHSYDYQDLLARLSNKKDTIECGKAPYHSVDIPDLIEHCFEKEKETLKNEEDPIPSQMSIEGNNNTVYVQVANKGEMTSDSSHNKRKITVEEGNYNESVRGDYNQQTGNNNQFLTGNQSSANPEQNDQSSQEKVDKNFIVKPVTILLAFLVLLGISIFNDPITKWLFPSSTPELEQQEKENN